MNYEDVDIVMEDEKPASDNQYKSFLDLSDYRKRCRTDPLVVMIKKFITDKELIKNNKTPLSVNQLLGYLLHRLNNTDNKRLANIGAQIFKDELPPAEVDVSNAISLKHDLTLSKEDMRVVKRYFNEKGVLFHNTTKLLTERKKLRPEIEPVHELDEQGVFVDYKELVKITTNVVFPTAMGYTGQKMAGIAGKTWV